jgi:alpha-glucosidase (family GH31 glycosyl hydrolase)
MSATVRVCFGAACALAAAVPGDGAAQAAEQSQPIALEWQQVAPGVWRANAGAPERVTLLGAAGVRPRAVALAQLGSVDFPLVRDDIAAFRHDGKLYVRFPLGAREQLYGLGLNFKAVQQRGVVKELHVDHFGGTDNGRTHAPVPFYVSSAGYGVLVDVARYVTVYAGTTVRRDSKHPPMVRDRNTDRGWTSQPLSDAVEVLVPASGATLYVFGGPTPLAAVRRYNLYSGGGALPPKWGLGFLQRVPRLYTAAQVLQEVDDFRTRDFPLDVIGLEPGWQSRAYPNTFVWDPVRFPDPAAFMTAMKRRGIGVNLWINPYVSPEAPTYAQLKDRSASHTVWTGIVPDYSLPDVQAVLLAQFREQHLRLGVSGYKIDEADGYDRWLWPDHATFPSGLSGEQMRQVYGLYLQRMIDSLYRAQDRRTYGLTRASNAGAAALPFVIYNDSYTHQDFITALISSSFIGVLWTPEARSSRTGEEWLRRMQSVCFSPLAMINAWADGTKPWSFPEVTDHVRAVMQLRIRLLPYLYTAFARYHFEGVPPFRAMALIDGFVDDPRVEPTEVSSTDNPYGVARRRDIRDQYLMGDDVLVAPLFAGDSTRQVVLPAGKWYDFYTGEYVGSGAVIQVRAQLDRIPLFVRDGGIVPLLAQPSSAATDLEVRHYGEAASRFALYDDDGVTFGYERGAYAWATLSVTRDARGRLHGSVTLPDKNKPFSYRGITWKFMSAP